MPFEIVQKPAFLDDFLLLEKSVQKKASKAVKAITANPFGEHSKKLEKYKNLYRWRLGDHRLCYSVGTGCVALLAIGPRSEIYSRFNIEGDVPSDIDFASAEAIPTVPDDPIPQSLPEGGDRSAPGAATAPRDHAGLIKTILEFAAVPEEYHKQILKCRTADELLELNIPQQYISTILHIQAPPRVEAIAEQPTLVLEQPEDLERWADGTLTGFLLRLDPEQEKAAAKSLKGPALVKGGAGTGKSLVALYRIRNMFTTEAQSALFAGAKPRVLFVTFTNSLTTASQQLLSKLLPAHDLSRVDVMTLDALASRYARGLPKDRVGRLRDTVVVAQTLVKKADNDEHRRLHEILAKFTPEYLADEIEWIIDGRGITSLAEYLEAPRPGRGQRLDLQARKAVWELYREWRALLKKRGQSTFGQHQLSALETVKSLDAEKKYDCVVLDEAQDLKPVGIRLALEMCKSPEGFYMTADEAQSIYGRGYSWRQVSDDLRLQGRTITLKRNYRGTAELQAATDDFLRASKLSDDERKIESVRHGKKPLAVETAGDPVPVIASHFQAARSEMGVPLSACAVLVKTNDLGTEVARKLRDQGLEASFFESKAIDLEAQCVKVMTIHSAKGLEFPIVAITGLRNGLFPAKRVGLDEKEALEHDQQERRLFHVAISRAMRRLLIVYPKGDPSDFIADLNSELWEWQSA